MNWENAHYFIEPNELKKETKVNIEYSDSLAHLISFFFMNMIEYIQTRPMKVLIN